MTRTKSRKPAARKKRSSPKKPARLLFPGGIRIGRILGFCGLVLLFFISIAAAGYVIFFRVVVAAELSEAQGKPKVAIIIDDMGSREEIGRKLVALDLNLSFSFLPHTPFLADLEMRARERGRTIMMHLPLEPLDASKDPGPGAIYLDEHTGTIEDLFKDDLAQVVHATGVNNHMGSRFTRDKQAMQVLAGLLRENNLFFIDSYTIPDSVAMTVAAGNGVPASRGDFFIDNVQSSEAVCDRLADLVELAQRRKSAIAIGHPYAATLEALQSCAPAILADVEMVGADHLANDRAKAGVEVVDVDHLPNHGVKK